MPGPHDLFARYTFGRPERAEAELRAVLPAQVISAVDWSSLRLDTGSVVNPELERQGILGVPSLANDLWSTLPAQRRCVPVTVH